MWMYICKLSNFKEQLACVVDKQLWVISTVLLFIVYFAWEDQRQTQHFICYKIPSVLYKNTTQWLLQLR